MEIKNNLLHYTLQPDETKALTQRCLFLQITEEEAEKEALLRHSLHDSLDRHTVL